MSRLLPTHWLLPVSVPAPPLLRGGSREHLCSRGAPGALGSTRCSALHFQGRALKIGLCPGRHADLGGGQGHGAELIAMAAPGDHHTVTAMSPRGHLLQAYERGEAAGFVGALAGGSHRVRAATASGPNEAEADLGQGRREDAVLYAGTANQARRRRQPNADKRVIVKVALRSPKAQSLSEGQFPLVCGGDRGAGCR